LPISGASASSPIRAVTKAYARFGSQVVQVFSPVSRQVSSGSAGSATAVMPGVAPRAGEPPPSSVAALFSSAPCATIAR
jgi:hypothetical protein